MNPANMEDLAAMDVTVTNDPLLPLSLAVPTLLPTMRTTQTGRHVYWPGRYVQCMLTFTEGK